MFFVLEGIDGSGKTTQTDRLEGMLKSKSGRDELVRTREPGGWEGAAAARKFVLDGGLASLWGEFFFFMLDRCEHVERVIRPALSAGKIVLSDRYTPSTLAYQIFSNPAIDSETAEYASRLGDMIGLPVPDAVFFLDVSPDIASRRLAKRGIKDRFDGRGLEYYKSVSAGYKRTMASWSGKWVEIDASRDEDLVFRDIEAEILSMLAVRSE
ncbi:MAG: dTMP kinase [Synergistaceae bacterium]|jgi:dTMP kinase|nr:dTMP kinase [Synergistaceae bacterium]